MAVLQKATIGSVLKLGTLLENTEKNYSSNVMAIDYSILNLIYLRSIHFHRALTQIWDPQNHSLVCVLLPACGCFLFLDNFELFEFEQFQSTLKRLHYISTWDSKRFFPSVFLVRTSIDGHKIFRIKAFKEIFVTDIPLWIPFGYEISFLEIMTLQLSLTFLHTHLANNSITRSGIIQL